VQVERYIKNITIEADTLKSMVDTQILPACFSFYGAIASQVASAKTAGIAQIPQTELLTRLGSGIAAAQAKRLKLDQALQKAEAAPGDHERAKILSLDVASAMLDLRMSCDELEGWVADDHWPLPKYREMLFLG
jgi:glutamine synthetase